MRPTEFIRQVTSGKPGAIYFLRGPDRFLHEECRAAVVSAVPPEARAWCLAELEFESGTLARQLDNAHQIPMLAGHSYFLFSDPEDLRRAGDEDVEALESYLKKPSPCATLVFAAAEPDRRRRFIQLLEKKTAVVELIPPDRHEAAHWLEQYLRQAGVSIAPELAESVAARFEDRPDPRGDTKPGVNLLGMRTEVEKALTARPEAKRWEEADLDHIVSFREDHEISKLLEAIAERQLGRAIERLRTLLSSKEPEALILWSIGDLFRQALKSTAGAGRGGSGGGWYRGGRGSTFEIAQRAAKRYSPEELGQALRRTRDTDLAVKSSWKDSKVLLEILIWQVTVGKAGSAWAEPSWVGAADA
ncbi:MAG TPA: DNA polymerase III subunit delta [Terriglobia bacterium]|jgi:DNA polymerase III delta subunit|nr:DNA polymerase III subunit delta [Terriglobia bacterium]